MSNEEVQPDPKTIDADEAIKHVKNIVEASKFFGELDKHLGKHLLGVGSQLTDFLINIEDVCSHANWAETRTAAAESKYSEEIDAFAKELEEG